MSRSFVNRVRTQNLRFGRLILRLFIECDHNIYRVYIVYCTWLIEIVERIPRLLIPYFNMRQASLNTVVIFFFFFKSSKRNLATLLRCCFFFPWCATLVLLKQMNARASRIWLLFIFFFSSAIPWTVAKPILLARSSESCSSYSIIIGMVNLVIFTFASLIATSGFDWLIFSMEILFETHYTNRSIFFSSTYLDWWKRILLHAYIWAELKWLLIVDLNFLCLFFFYRKYPLFSYRRVQINFLVSKYTVWSFTQSTPQVTSCVCVDGRINASKQFPIHDNELRKTCWCVNLMAFSLDYAD